MALHFLRKHQGKLNKQLAGISEDVLDMFHQYHWPGNVRELEHVVEGAMNFVAHGEMIGLDHLQSHLPIWYRLKDQASTPDTVFGAIPGEDEEERPVSLPNMEAANETRASGAIAMQKFFETQSHREKHLIETALSKYKGNVTQSAKSIGISRQLLHYKMKKHGLIRESFQ